MRVGNRAERRVCLEGVKVVVHVHLVRRRKHVKIPWLVVHAVVGEQAHVDARGVVCLRQLAFQLSFREKNARGQLARRKRGPAGHPPRA